MKKRVLMALAFLTLISQAAYASDTKMSTQWTSTSLSQIECLKRATNVLWMKKFTTNQNYSEVSAWGESGPYEALIRCVSEKNVLFFVVIGPSGKKTREYVDALSTLFEEQDL